MPRRGRGGRLLRRRRGPACCIRRSCGGSEENIGPIASGRRTLGHLLRGGTPSSFDRLLATRFGVRAAQCCAHGELGKMVALRGQDVVAVPLADSIRKPKHVPTHGELVAVAESLGIELGG